MNNLDRQNYEVEAMASIVSAEEMNAVVFDKQHHLKMNIFLTAPQKLLFLSFKKPNSNAEASGSSEDDTSFTVSHLPSIELSIVLPKNYPSESPPSYEISCLWLSSEDLQSICNHLDSMWSNNEVLFEWTQFLKDDALALLGINSKYAIMTRDEKSKPVCNSNIKDCSENYDEKFLREYLSNYDEERELSEFKKSYFNCEICFESKLGQNCFRLKPCNHVYCMDCIRTYLETRIIEGSVNSLGCPGCDNIILPAEIREIVGEELFAKYDNLLLTTTLETMQDIVRCPRKACQYPVTKVPGEKLAQCPSCQYAFCGKCLMGYHGVDQCRIKCNDKASLFKEYQKGNNEVKMRMEQKYGKNRLRRLIQMMLSEKWIDDNSKNCVACDTAIEKSEGCNKMVCWRCGTYFCWTCLKKLDPVKPYAHFYNRNSPCYNRLFEGVPDDDEE